MFYRTYIFIQGPFFHCYVRLPECRSNELILPSSSNQLESHLAVFLSLSQIWCQNIIPKFTDQFLPKKTTPWKTRQTFPPTFFHDPFQLESKRLMDFFPERLAAILLSLNSPPNMIMHTKHQILKKKLKKRKHHTIMFFFGKEDYFNSTDILVRGELPPSRMASPLAKVIERSRAHTWNFSNSKQLTPWLISCSRKSGISMARKRPI